MRPDYMALRNGMPTMAKAFFSVCSTMRDSSTLATTSSFVSALRIWLS